MQHKLDTAQYSPSKVLEVSAGTQCHCMFLQENHLKLPFHIQEQQHLCFPKNVTYK